MKEGNDTWLFTADLSPSDQKIKLYLTKECKEINKPKLSLPFDIGTAEKGYERYNVVKMGVV